MAALVILPACACAHACTLSLVERDERLEKGGSVLPTPATSRPTKARTSRLYHARILNHMPSACQIATASCRQASSESENQIVDVRE